MVPPLLGTVFGQMTQHSDDGIHLGVSPCVRGRPECTAKSHIIGAEWRFLSRTVELKLGCSNSHSWVNECKCARDCAGAVIGVRRESVGIDFAVVRRERLVAGSVVRSEPGDRARSARREA